LFTAPGCPHCQTVKRLLQQLQQEGLLAPVTVVDISQEPELAQQQGVRSVPWLELGELVLVGAHSQAELRHWIGLASSPAGLASFFDHLLTTGQAGLVEQRLRQCPQQIDALLELLANPDTSINSRVGIGAVFESLAEDGLLGDQVDALAVLCRHENATIRADACHFLGLTGSRRAIPVLTQCLQDQDPQVVEIAQESLAALQNA
jgi:glutaredoxin